MYFHTAMVDNKKQYFWLLLLVIFVVNSYHCWLFVSLPVQVNAHQACVFF